MYAEVRRTPFYVHTKEIMRGVHCLTLQTVKQKFVSISKAVLPSGEERLTTQKVKAFRQFFHHLAIKAPCIHT